jgi:Ca2+-binding EF-hand superfamily protein
MLATIEYVDFLTIRKFIDITDYDLFIVYLKELYKDLSFRSESTKKRGITKVTFLDYIKLPLFIGEKLFFSLDRDKDSYLSSVEFVEGLGKLYLGDFLQTVTSVFNILDFDKDGVINKEDARILLSYIPLKGDKNEIEYEYQMESLEEINDILLHTFNYKNTMRLDDFIKVIENKKSDIFLQILCFLYQKKPFNERHIKNLNFAKKKLSLNTSEKEYFSPQVSPKRLPSPNKKSLLSPVHSFWNLTINKMDQEDSSESKKNLESPHKSGTKGMVRLPNEKVINLRRLESTHSENITSMMKNSKNIFESPTITLNKIKHPSANEFTIEKSLMEMNIVDRDSDLHIEYEDFIFKISESQKLKRYWLVLKGKDIYYYKNAQKEELLGMHNLSGCFVDDNGEKKVANINLFSFSLTCAGKVRCYYIQSKESCQKWMTKIKQAIGYLNFFDYYEMLEDLGEGKFGKVKLGVYKKTREKVAIKIIKKSSLENLKDIELVKSEIDIMKLCRHPNVVKLIDHFENSEYIFIVMELLKGGNLGEYFNKNKFQITEKRAAKIMYQLASGVKYLHHYGILHRDIKPDNIMLSDTTEDASVKVMDFGLSKIMGSQEKVADGYGSLSFVAPEVLIRQPYNKQIDIWSLGVILYYMLSGTLPFDDVNDNEENIAKLIVFADVKFPAKYWSKRSFQVVDLITRCLIKNQSNRIKVDEFLEHEWIINNIL